MTFMRWGKLGSHRGKARAEGWPWHFPVLRLTRARGCDSTRRKKEILPSAICNNMGRCGGCHSK